MADVESSHADEKSQNVESTLGGMGHSNALGNGVQEEAKRGHLAFVNANIYQAAILNKLLPAGFKIDFVENVQKSYESKLAAQRKAA